MTRVWVREAWNQSAFLTRYLTFHPPNSAEHHVKNSCGISPRLYIAQNSQLQLIHYLCPLHFHMENSNIIDPATYIRTRSNFGGSTGINSQKTNLMDIIKAAASDPKLRTLTNRYWDHDNMRMVELNTEDDKTGKAALSVNPKTGKSAWSTDHFFELQFLAVLFALFVPDKATDSINTAAFERFTSHICNGSHNLCGLASHVHEMKNSFFTNTGVMKPELLAYLRACTAEFSSAVTTELTSEGSAGEPGEPTIAYYEFLRALRTTPFCTNEWPAVGFHWWVQ